MAGGKVKFRPKARLLSLLGHELITDEVIALVELVKNSYDADATRVDVRLTDVAKKSGGVIEIKDDGHGMTLDILRRAWMEPARDNKKDKEGKRPRTKRFGRLLLGEKGVGRFSVDKLGLKVELITRYCEFDEKTKEVSHLSDEEVVLLIEGKQFTEDLYLDEIECEWLTRKPQEFREDSHGTLLRISDPRTTWTGEMVEKVRLGLSRLSSPISEAKDFKITLVSNEFPELSTEIKNPLLEIAPWILDAKIDENGIMRYTVEGLGKKEQDERDIKIGSDHFRVQGGGPGTYRKPDCGPFKFKLYGFERERKSWKEFGLDKTKIELLTDLCGVSIYRDGFRVMPYGEKGNDWMYFDKRRIQNPGKTLGNDRVIGYVEISQKSNPFLRDKTNREGLIDEGQAFADLRELAINASDLLELFRQKHKLHKKRSKEKVDEAKDDIETGSNAVEEILSRVNKKIDEENTSEAKVLIQQLMDGAQSGEIATGQIREGAKKLLEELKLYDEQINNLVSLSGIGMTAERMTHELSVAASNANKLVKRTIKFLDTGRLDRTSVKKHLSNISGQLQIIIDHIRQMEPLYYSKRRRTEKIDVGELAKDLEKFYAGTIIQIGIKLEITEESKLSVEMNKGHFLQVFNNLFDNSFFWLENTPARENPRISIKISRKPEKSIIFADNGPGIDKIVEGHLFDPFITTKPGGRGLGLYIVNDILQNYKAKIEVMSDGKILKGANFKITFPEG